MIGGTDVIFLAEGDPVALDGCARIVQRYWPRASFEDALTGKRYGGYGDLPIGRIRELFVYQDSTAEAAWDAENGDAGPNSMIYLILSPNVVTAVVDDPNAGQMRFILASIRRFLTRDILYTEPVHLLAEAA
jgi:hypothetical protein